MAAPIDIEIKGIEECMRALQSLQTDLRKLANGELRTAAKGIGRDVVIPMLGGSGSPQEQKIVAAAGPKSDRYVVVAVPARKPRLTGLKKTPAPMAKRIAFALEGGSTYPPFHGPRQGSVVASHVPAMRNRAVPRYQQELARILNRYGLL